MKFRMTAQKAMEESARGDRVITIEASEQNIAALKRACDDWVVTYRMTEYWGRTDDGDEWRVRVAEVK